MKSPSDDSLLACLSDEIATFVHSYSDTDLVAKQSMHQLMQCDENAFLHAAVRVLSSNPATDGSKYLVTSLLKDRTLVKMLMAPGGFTLGQATAAVRGLGSALEASLEGELSILIRAGNPDDELILRLLELMEAGGVERRCLLFQEDLLTSKNAAVRSKAAKLVTRCSRKASVAGRMLLDPDPRVQASAVEGMWGFEREEAVPLLVVAARSRHHRVAANGAIGLYRCHEPAALRLIWNLVRSPDPQTRTSGIWVMGEAADPRFLTYLESLEQAPNGVPKPVVTRALLRVRTRLEEARMRGPVEIRFQRASLDASGRRRLAFSVGPASIDIDRIHALEFSIEEGGTEVTEYELVSEPNPPVLVVGFIMPRIAGKAEPLRLAIDSGILRCLELKRPDDPWRIDRYCTDQRPERSRAGIRPVSPYDDLIPVHKLQRGFFNDAAYVPRILEAPGSRERAARDLPTALDRSLDTMSAIPGTRHVFVFIEDGCTEGIPSIRWVKHLVELCTNARITLHAYVPTGTPCDDIREAIESTPGASFDEVPVEGLTDHFVSSYSALLNGFAITYTLAADPLPGTLTLCSSCGEGSAKFELKK